VLPFDVVSRVAYRGAYDTDDVEILCVDVLCHRSLFRFIVIYRPPQYGIEAREYANKLVSRFELVLSSSMACVYCWRP